MIKNSIHKELESRILLLDGALGTMVQGYKLEEKDYRGEEFQAVETPLKGCNDLLVITAPEVIKQIHEAYIKAGSDIISTCSFNANAISLADYGLEAEAYRLNYASASLARELADKYTVLDPSKPRFVAGSMGPTNRTASMSADVNDPAAREVTFEQLVEAYSVQAQGLIDGGVDLLLVETIFDTLNAKAALFAIDQVCEHKGIEIPIMVSGTVADISGRMLSGQTIEAFYTSLRHAKLLSVGLNCGFGAEQMRPFIERLAAIAEVRTSAYPNAGLPNVMGGYDETPQMMAEVIESYLKGGLLNIVGGCCGTTPQHIEAFAKVAQKYAPRAIPQKNPQSVLSGLERLIISPESNFINVGERCNVAGSAKFARLIREQNYEEALIVAQHQVESGAQIIDVCMDDGLIDGEAAMTKFLNLMMSEPEISRLPIMIDSSSWSLLEMGLRCVQGKCIVNSISLKEGEEIFLSRAKLLHRYGAAVVVMLFDERGQADSFDRKIEVAQRAYDLLVGSGFPAEDIVFDPNILAVATGIEEHDNYGVDFIEACRWIKQNLPLAKVSGGVSNLSFSFRGNNVVREAMHSVFLYHAIEAGMDMGIVNPAMLQIYSEIEPKLLQLTEDVVLNRSEGATERLMEYAQQVKGSATVEVKVENRLELPLDQRIDNAMLRGVTEHIEEDTLEGYKTIGSALGVIDQLLMPAMTKVGELFGAGKMFLPQVVKSARVMKRGVDVLTPYIEQGGDEDSASTKVLIATVKGDVHDIGKNIVSVVMACNGYVIEDMGVMVECDAIVAKVKQWGADCLGLSGLITPSLEEMIKVVTELERQGITIPVLIGGATTSKLHTAVKIAPHYSGVVVNCRDASDNIRVLAELCGAQRESFIAEVKVQQQKLRESYELQLTKRKLLTIEQARKARAPRSAESVVTPKSIGRVVINDYPIAEVVDFIEWSYLFAAWEIKGSYPEILKDENKGEQARKILEDAKMLLSRIESEKLLTMSGIVSICRARSVGDDIIVEDDKGEEFILSQLRNQTEGDQNRSLSDYVPEKEGYIAPFIVTAGLGLDDLIQRFKAEGDQYSAIMAKLLADRLTEAFAQRIHKMVKEEIWGFDAHGLRVAFGYPAAPDHSLKGDLHKLLRVEEQIPITITDNYMLNPAESICGLIFDDPRSSYFSVGKIAPDQLQEYAQRRKIDKGLIEQLIANHIQ